MPIYIEVDDGIRLERALERERRQQAPDYEEMCRRFIADCHDFSEENIAECNINKRYSNNAAIEQCLSEIRRDIGVLYGNLVDNAVEACSKVPEGQRFVKIENKYQSGILLLIITNSKTGKKNKSLKTTKKDNIRHGHGVQSVRKVVEKYNGTVSFTDKGDIFEVSAMLYGIEVKE